MPIYLIVGPAAAVIGIVAIFFVMRHRSVQTKSMYSSRRAQIERKVKSARQRTLAPRGRGDRPPTAAEIAAAAPGAPVYQAPASPAPRQSWDVGAAPAPSYSPPSTPAPEYSPPPAPPASPFGETSTPAPGGQPEWSSPAPSEPLWTPTPGAAPEYPAPVQATPTPAPAAVDPPSYPAGGGASWEIIGDAAAPPAPEPAKGKKDKDRDKDKQPQQQGSEWSLSSGNPPGAAEDGEEEPKKPSAAMALAQYAVLVVGLVMVLIGVLVMVANSKVT